MKKKSHKKQRKFGLIGKNIDYSFSKKYFSDKFAINHFDNCEYENYDIKNINQFNEIIKSSKGLVGLNVTIPYKEEIIAYLNKLSKKG